MLRALISLCLLIGVSGQGAAQSLVVAVPSDVLGDYRRWLGGRDVVEVDSYLGEGVRRDVVEVALFGQALALGCGDVTVEWLEVDSYPRTLLLLRQLHVDAAATTVWRRDIDAGEVALSSVVIPDGRFVAALYSTKDNPIVFSEPSDLERYSIVSSSHWVQDWKVLQSLPFSAHHNVNGWATMLRWVASGKADVLMAPMVPEGQPYLAALNITLGPVVGARVVLPGSRHFAFSPSPLGKTYSRSGDASNHKLMRCFNKGLAELSQTGRIERAYQQSGFWRPDFMLWPEIN